jgi:hypothetical protein
MNKTELRRRLKELDALTHVEVEDQDDVIPAEVWVGAMPFQISLQHLPGGNGHLGHCDIAGLAIALSPDQAQPRKRETLLHEVMHALVEFCGFEDSEGYIHVTNEELVNRLAPALLDVIRANRDMAFYLLTHTDP